MANKRRHISDINEILDYVTNDIDSDMDMDLGESDFEDDAESLEYESEVEDGHEVEEETNIEMTTDSQVGILMVDEPVENNNFIIVDEDNHVFEAENIDIPGGEVSSEAEEEQADKILPPTTSPTHPNRSNLNHPNNNNAMQSAERNLDVNVADDDIIADDNISHSDTVTTVKFQKMTTTKLLRFQYLDVVVVYPVAVFPVAVFVYAVFVYAVAVFVYVVAMFVYAVEVLVLEVVVYVVVVLALVLKVAGLVVLVVLVDVVVDYLLVVQLLGRIHYIGRQLKKTKSRFSKTLTSYRMKD